MFKNINEIKTAKTSLYNFKQTKLAILYIIEFQKYAAKTGWDSNALISIYYKGLKNYIKLKLA